MKTKRQRWKSSLRFGLCILPLGLLAGALVGYYLMATVEPAVLEKNLAAVGGSKAVLLLVTAIQTALMTFLAAFAGHALSTRMGLWKPLHFEKRPLLLTLAGAALTGLLIASDYWVSAGVVPNLREVTLAGMTVPATLTAILYGGIMEELLLRLFLMTLLGWVLWKLFGRASETPPVWTLIAANVLAALLFAAGHLPATQAMFGELTAFLLLRCFVLNGTGGLVFGWLYRKYGIQYAMLAHAGAHLVMRLVWLTIL